MQTGVLNEPDVDWGYLAPEHGEHIFFYSEKTVSFLEKAPQMAALFIQGYIVIIRVELLESLFIKGTNTLRADFLSKVSQSIHSLLNKI